MQAENRASALVAKADYSQYLDSGEGMKLDIRLPLGLLFLVFGVLLGSFGLAGNQAIYDRSLGININLWWGIIMLVFGLAMVLLGRRGERRASALADSAADRPTVRGASEHE
jgi:hypothetical protein